MLNKDLKRIYNKIYQLGEKRHYSKNLFNKGIALQAIEALKEFSWKDKAVLDVGCGTGLFVHLVKKAGAKRVVGVDYSKEAIRLAKEKYDEEGIEFYCQDFRKISGRFDVVASLGAIEHFDSPQEALKKFKSLIKGGGSIIIVCPNWTNIRGYILLTLFYLLGAPITLADKHYLTPLEFKKWARKLKMKMSFRTFDYDWAFRAKMIKDFRRRLPKILPGNKNIKRFINWLDQHVKFVEKKTQFNGAVALYHFR